METDNTFELRDISKGLSNFLSIKDDYSLKQISFAYGLCIRSLYRKVIPRLEQIITNEKAVAHSKFSNDCISELTGIFRDRKPGTAPADLSVTKMTVQSAGSGYSLGLMSSSQSSNIDFSSVVVTLIIQCNNYNSAIARTIYVNPLPSQESAYKSATKAYLKAFNALIPGATLGDVAMAARKVLEEEQPDLVQYLVPNFGRGIGIQTEEGVPAPAIEVGSKDVAKEGMAFVLQMGLENIPVESSDKKYAIYIANTVVVDKDRARPVFEPKNNGKAQSWSKNFEWNDISYKFSADSEKDGENGGGDKGTKGGDDSDKSDGKSAGERTYANDSKTDEYRPIAERLRGVNYEAQNETLINHQKELSERKLEEMRRRLLSGKGGAFGKSGMSTEDFSKIVSFKSAASIIAAATPQKVTIDNMSHSIILPMFGFMVPFHFDLIKNITSHGKVLRVTFNTAASANAVSAASSSSSSSSATSAPSDDTVATASSPSMDVEKENDLNGELLYIKDMKIAIDDEKESYQIVTNFKHAKASAQAKNETEIAPQGQIHILERPPVLNDVCINPSTSSKRQGILKAHRNGFRYSMPRLSTPIDILYSNIKYSFFQKPDHEACIQIHFVLKSPIMVGKKKTAHVNFFTEVTVQTSNLAQQRSHYGDSEGLEEEARERRMRRKYTENYENFIKSVKQICPDLEFGK